MCIITKKSNNLLKLSPIENDVASDEIVSNYYKKSHIGVNETGSGDFFGPLCVVACYVDERDVDWLTSIGVSDPTEMSTENIINLAKQIKDRIIYSLLILDNSHYNEIADEGNNLANIKSKLYNQSVTNVIQKLAQNIEKKVANQFVSPKTYFNYLKNEVIVVKDLEFIKENGSREFLALMCSEILSRYAYYQYFNNMAHSLKLKIPRGNTTAVDHVAIEIAEKYGFKMLNKVTKKNFTNFKRVKAALDKK